jgi:uncharacterized Zn finger protein (UPF0148 family)
VEVRQRGKPLAVVRQGEVYCARCGVSVGVKADQPEVKTVFRGLS